MTEAGMGESMVANAELDITALRRYRNKPVMGNLLSRQRNELFVPMHQKSVYPANNMLTSTGEIKPIDRSHFMTTQLKTIARLKANGLIKE